MTRISKKKAAIFCVTVLISIMCFFGLRSCFRSFIEKYAEDTYHLKYFEVDSKELLLQVEKDYDVNFPEDIREIKAAATDRTWDSPNETSYIMRFFADSNTVDKFLKSIHENIYWKPYSITDDPRGTTKKLFSLPSWFTTPIRQGKIGSFDVTRIYIDTTNDSNNIVYIIGCCHIGEKLLEKIKQKKSLHK